MKKLLLSIFIVIPSLLFAQTPPWQWALYFGDTTGSDGMETVVSTVMDANDNIYILGTFESSALQLGSFVLSNNGPDDAFIIKLDPSGVVLWANSIKGNLNPENICCSSTGDLYISGSFYNTFIQFGNDTLFNHSSANSDAFLLKMNPSGNFIWGKCEGDYGNEVASSVATDRAGNVYIAGEYNSATMTFGTSAITSQGDYDLFVAKYDSSGNFLWVKTSGGIWLDAALALATDTFCNVFLGGWFGSDSIPFGQIMLMNSNGSTYDYFLVKLDSSGQSVWAKNGYSPGRKDIRQIRTDEEGNVYFTGIHQCNPLVFGNDTLQNADSTLQTNDIFLAKCNSSGSELWAKNIGGSDNDYCLGLSVNTTGDAFLSGYSRSRALDFGSVLMVNADTSAATYAGFTCHYDANGNFIWMRPVDGPDNDEVSAISVSKNGSVYASGTFSSTTINLDQFIIRDGGSESNIFTAKLNELSGISFPEVFSGVTIFPVPFHNTATVDLSMIDDFHPRLIQVIDLMGRIIVSAQADPGNSNIVLNGERFTAGTYLVRIMNGEGKEIQKKIVVE